jgi:hypothetical protein
VQSISCVFIRVTALQQEWNGMCKDWTVDALQEWKHETASCIYIKWYEIVSNRKTCCNDETKRTNGDIRLPEQHFYQIKT